MLIPLAHAQAAAPAAADTGSGGGFLLFLPYLLLIPVFYFLVMRPQQQRAKQQAAKIAGVKRGDTVITSGGIQGKVTKVEDQFAEVEIAQNVRVRVVKATLTDVSGTGPAAND